MDPVNIHHRRHFDNHDVVQQLLLTLSVGHLFIDIE